MIWYYGGKFNPITQSHLAIIKETAKNLTSPDNYIVIGICCNCDDYCGRADLVYAALKEMFSGEPKKLENITVIRQDDTSLWQFLKDGFRYQLPNGNVPVAQRKDIRLVLGGDEYVALNNSFNKDGNIEGAPWKFAKEITDNFGIEWVPRTDDVSSSAVREIFRRDPCVPYKSVEKYISFAVWHSIEQDCLYGQLGFEDVYARRERVALSKYDATKFKQPSATVDIIATRPGEANNPSSIKDWEILLIRRKNYPYKGFWALPGGFLDVDSDLTLEAAARREFLEETGIDFGFWPFHQFHTYSDMGSDPRCRIVDTVYAVPMGFFDLNVPKPKAGDDAAELDWFPLSSLPRLGFNHRQIIEDWMTEKTELMKEAEAETKKD